MHNKFSIKNAMTKYPAKQAPHQAQYHKTQKNGGHILYICLPSSSRWLGPRGTLPKETLSTQFATCALKKAAVKGPLIECTSVPQTRRSKLDSCASFGTEGVVTLMGHDGCQCHHRSSLWKSYLMKVSYTKSSFRRSVQYQKNNK